MTNKGKKIVTLKKSNNIVFDTATLSLKCQSKWYFVVSRGVKRRLSVRFTVYLSIKIVV